MLEIKNLHAEIENEGREILRGLDLVVKPGEVHAIMGPNGAGKSTLSHVLAGKPGYRVTDGSALLDGVDILDMDPSLRAANGVFLAFQYPVEIPGVANMTFLKAALNADCDGQAGLQELAGNATLLFYLSEEGQEGRNAYLEKRKPDFRKFPRLP